MHFTLSIAPAHHFFTTLKSHEAVQTGHWRTMASLVTPFLHLHTCAQIIVTQQLLFKIA